MSDQRIINNGISQAISFSPTQFKKLAVWTVHFEDGEEAMLYKCGGEWMQRNEGALDAPTLIAIGSQIDHLDKPLK